jgi:cytoplasmic iron level regulating protein YaaA (DUF328/UPF0246 family)
MLIIVPPSESKRPPAASGRPVVIEELSFPSLLPTRRRIADALIETSAHLDAFERLYVRPTIAPEVARNTRLLELPAMPVLDVYTGPLHDGLDAARLSAAASERAGEYLVIVSALWGALRPVDRIPPYRLHVCSRLVGMDRLEPTWREVLPEVLAKAAGEAGVVVDLRSPVYQATGMPAGIGDRTVTLRVDQGPAGHRIGDVIAKRVRGEAARHLLESSPDPESPDDLADILAARWPVRLASPDRRGGPWTMTLSID